MSGRLQARRSPTSYRNRCRRIWSSGCPHCFPSSASLSVQCTVSPYWIDFGSRAERRHSTAPSLMICRSGLRPIASRRSCTRPRCAFSLIAPMPKSTAPKRRRSPPRISAVEKTAVRIMRKLYETTGASRSDGKHSANLARSRPMPRHRLRG